MKRLDEITIADLMPDSIYGDAQVSATASAIDPPLRLISEAVDRPLILAAIDDLSAGVLEHLAVQYDVTSWDSAWPIETKRAVLKTAIADKRKMGTRGAVQRAIEAVAPIATLTEWWQDTNGDMLPHTFKIDLLQDGSAVDPETQANVISQVNEAKPVRSHYTFTAIQKGESGLYFAGVLRAISYARVRSAGISIEQTSIDAGVLAALRGMNIRRLLASSHMGEMPEPVVPDTTLFGGDFSGNNISLDSVDGGGSLVSRYNASRELFPNTGWIGGEMIDRHGNSRALFELQGWSPGGVFERPPLKTILGGIITDTSSTSFEVDAVEPMTQGSIEFASDLLTYALPSIGGIVARGSIEFSGDLLTYTMPSIGGIVEEYDPNVLEMIFGLRWETDNPSGGWRSINFNTGYSYYAGILNNSDRQTLENFGLSVFILSRAGIIGNVTYDSNYTFEVMAVYSDIGETEIQFDPSYLRTDYYNSPEGGSPPYILGIYSPINANIQAMSWKCRITKNNQ